jgi:predicted RNase H-like HicB family nuclease
MEMTPKNTRSNKFKRQSSEQEKNKMEEAKHYSMVIQWDPESKIYVVDVPELPGCMTHGHTYEEATQQGQDAIESWIMVAKDLNRPVPPPNTYIAA